MPVGCCPLQAGCIQFYRRFLECPNFSSWFERGRGRAALWQEAAWAQAQLERGTELILEDSSEVQLVEAFAALEHRLDAAVAAAASPTESAPQVLLLNGPQQLEALCLLGLFSPPGHACLPWQRLKGKSAGCEA